MSAAPTASLSLAVLRLLADRSPEPVGIHSEGVLLHANERLARMLRVPEGERLEGRSLASLVIPSARPSIATRVETHSNVDELPTPFETRMACADGAVIEVETISTRLEIDGAPVVMSTIRDISPRKRAEAARRDLDAALEAAQRFASFGMWLELPESGRGPEWTPQMYRIFGVDPGTFEYSREKMAALIHPDDLGAVLEGRQRLLDGADRYDVEYRVLHAGGEVRWVHALGGLEVAADGSRRVVGIAQDVTERRAVEARLASAQKMEAIGRLAGGIAHDFNNLLMVMMGQVAVAKRRLERPDDVTTALRELDLAIERAASLTQQLLAFARRQVSRQEVIDFAAVLREIEALITRIIGEDVALDLAISAEPAWVRADRSQLEQVVFNLVVNARDAMPDGGPLSVRLFETNERGLAPEIVLEVSDEGSGIAPSIVDRIFEPFFTTKAPNQSSGLGLSTVYAIVEQASGRIEVESAPDRKGSLFRVRLPSATAPHTASRGPRPSAPDPVTHRGEVLLVEDDALVRRVVSVALRDLGFVVHTTESAEHALELLRGPARRARTLLSDVVMPGMSGAALARRARELVSELKVLLMSGYAADHIDQGLLGDRGVRFLQKPVSVDDLARALEALEREH